MSRILYDALLRVQVSPKDIALKLQVRIIVQDGHDGARRQAAFGKTQQSRLLSLSNTL